MMEVFVLLFIIGSFGLCYWLYSSNQTQSTSFLTTYRSFVVDGAVLNGKDVSFYQLRQDKRQRYYSIPEGKISIQGKNTKLELDIGSKLTKTSGGQCEQLYIESMTVNQRYLYSHQPGQFTRYIVSASELESDVQKALLFLCSVLMANNKLRKTNRFNEVFTDALEFSEVSRSFLHHQQSAESYLFERTKLPKKNIVSCVNEHMKVLEFQQHEQVSLEEVKARYRLMAKRYHPDSPTGDIVKFKRVKEAYEQIKKKHVAI